jgi:hypothetical protein
MRRRDALATLIALGAASAPGRAAAEPGDTSQAEARPLDYVVVDPAPRRRDRLGPDVLYLNRCAGGCAVGTDGNSAAANQSTIPAVPGTLSAFAWPDPAWDQVVACVQATYRPYGVEVVTTEPAGGDAHVEVMVAGAPAELGLMAGTLGIAPLAADCSAQVGVIAFAFANVHQDGNVLDICATAAHEAGHVYGLDHAFDCRDPMTYLIGCGQKYFAHLNLTCGEFDGARPCKCGERQNTHVSLTEALGEGAAPTGGAEVTIPYPAAAATLADGETVFVQVGPWRPLRRVELWINGTRWVRQDAGAAALYMLPIPAAVPDGVLDLETRVIDDLGGVSRATVQVTKRAPCGPTVPCSAGTCGGDGRCVIAAGAAALGDACDGDRACGSQLCVDDGRDQLCSDDCLVGVPTTGCPDAFTCLPLDAVSTSGVCWPDDLAGAGGDGGGCCDAGDGAPPLGLPVGLGFGLLLRSRRRRARRRP